MDLYIYDRKLGLVGVLDITTSIRWRRKYFEPGEVEVHTIASRESMLLLSEGRIMRRTDRLESAIIERIEIQDDDLGVTGRMLSSLLDRAILSRRYTLRTSYEQAMRSLLPEATRVVPELRAGELKGFSEQVEMQATYKTVLTVVKRLARASGLGFRLLFSLGDFPFEVYRGLDRSIAQNENPVVLFSDEFGNLLTPRYMKTSLEYKNYAYVGGAGEGDARTVLLVDQSNGEERRELFVDAKDIQREEGSTQADYLALLQQRGVEKLAECCQVESFEAEGQNIENFAYLVDWDLGDIVTVYYAKLGISMHERITEVEEVYENGVVRLIPTFGSPLPETLDLGEDSI